MIQKADLPSGNVPELPDKQISPDAYVQWLHENRRILAENGLLGKLLDERPVPSGRSFVLR